MQLSTAIQHILHVWETSSCIKLKTCSANATHLKLVAHLDSLVYSAARLGNEANEDGEPLVSLSSIPRSGNGVGLRHANLHQTDGAP